MEHSALFLRFGLALGTGLLIGIQREYAHGGSDREMLAGSRTFALLGLFGCIAAMIADELKFPWVFIGLAMLVGVLIGVAYFVVAWTRQEVGLTTEVAALMSVMIGALYYLDYLALAAALGVTTTVVLALKLEMRHFMENISQVDILATLRFAVITAIILPVLPNRNFGIPPLEIFNPFKIWQMVVLISGISFLGYVLIKFVGPRRGIGLSGFLGGLVSSTAVTLSFTNRSQNEHGLARPFALAIIVSWTLMFLRVLAVVALLNQSLFLNLWLPILSVGVVGVLYCVYLYRAQPGTDDQEVVFSNPFELGPAIKFGLLYVGVLAISKAATVYLGNTGVYLSSIVAGMADVDAITLSMAQLSAPRGTLGVNIAERAIMLAAMANTVVKGGIVLFGGSRELRQVIWPAVLMIVLTGLGVGFLAT